MLSESQELVAMFTSYVKIEEKISSASVDERLADLWIKFEREVSDYLRSENLELNAVDILPRHEISDKLQNTDLKRLSRFLVHDYAKKVNQIIKDTLPAFQ